VSEPTFLTLDQVLVIHAQSLQEHGGTQGIRDLGLIESALASAQDTFYYANGDVFDVAASYAFLDGISGLGLRRRSCFWP